ncbi:MAG: class I SAM-dependent methyltransferase [Actinomycetota bacterium]|nr:class I SAM-dependent methyltransferase [Actinomycetota bacterium]
MAEVEQNANGSAATGQAELWGERARDWADVMEGWDGWGVPVYRHVLERVPVGRETSVLDVGCGAGRFCRIVADRGARVSGLDTTPALLEIAQERVPDGDFRIGDMGELPWDDGSFDLVTGFNSFFIAADMVSALAEARRVARPRAPVAMSVFGRPEHCQSTAMFRAVAGLLPAKPSGEDKKSAPALHEEGALEALARQAGLTPQEGGYLELVERYPNLETLVRGVMAAPPMVRAARTVGQDSVREALTEAFRAFETRTGSYALEEEVRYLIARA